MTMLESCSPTLHNPEGQLRFDEMQLAAAAFLARYSGRTLVAYRHDLRGFFQWAADHDIDVLAATRPHIELFRASMEERCLAASTRSVLATARGLPVVGKFLLQRTVIKIGIPLVGVPLAVWVNRWTTLITGRHARAVFRNEARVIEVAENLSERSTRS